MLYITSIAASSAMIFFNPSRSCSNEGIDPGSIVVTWTRCQPNGLSTGPEVSPAAREKAVSPNSTGNSFLDTVPRVMSFPPASSAATSVKASPSEIRAEALMAAASSSRGNCKIVRRSGVANSTARSSYASRRSCSDTVISLAKSCGMKCT